MKAKTKIKVKQKITEILFHSPIIFYSNFMYKTLSSLLNISIKFDSIFIKMPKRASTSPKFQKNVKAKPMPAENKTAKSEKLCTILDTPIKSLSDKKLYRWENHVLRLNLIDINILLKNVEKTWTLFWELYIKQTLLVAFHLLTQSNSALC